MSLVESLPDITAQQAAFLVCASFVVPPLLLLWFEEHVLKRPPKQLFDD